jgi:hypothetical protein
MNTNQYFKPALDRIGQVLFPGKQPDLRQKETRSFLLSLALGMMFCFAFAYILTTLNLQGRI